MCLLKGVHCTCTQSGPLGDQQKVLDALELELIGSCELLC